MDSAIVAKGIGWGAMLGAAIAAAFGGFVVLPGVVGAQSLPSLAVDAVVLNTIVAVGLVVGVLHGLVLGILVAVVWSATRSRMRADSALDVVAAATAVAVLESYVGIAGVDAWYGGLLLGGTAGIAARLGVRQVMVDPDAGPLRPAGHQLRGRIYVETCIRAPLDRVWALTQDPEQHARWDLRFGRIEPEGEAAGARRFRYSTAGVAGRGVHVGDRWRETGGATSSLRFASSHVLSPIAEGAGYWRYEPTGEALRFLTGYDYRSRYPHIGLVFRPLMGWATAWSFDRLRLWAERGQGPGRSFAFALADVVLRLAVVIGAGVMGDALSAAAAAILIWWIPVSPYVPAASRCRRHPPDERSATAPRALRALEEA